MSSASSLQVGMSSHRKPSVRCEQVRQLGQLPQAHSLGIADPAKFHPRLPTLLSTPPGCRSTLSCYEPRNSPVLRQSGCRRKDCLSICLPPTMPKPKHNGIHLDTRVKIDEFVIRPEFGTKQSTHRWACCQSAIRHGEPEPSTVGPRQTAPEALPATTHRSAVLPSCSSTACLPICLPIGPIPIRLVLGRMLGTLRASVPGGVTLADAEAVRAAASRELSTAATMSRDVSHGTCRTLANANCPCRRNPRNETRLGGPGCSSFRTFHGATVRIVLPAVRTRYHPRKGGRGAGRGRLP